MDATAEPIFLRASLFTCLLAISKRPIQNWPKLTSDLANAARELNVRAVVSGRIILLGDNVNVQAELVDLETRFQLWGGQCSRELSDSIELQEEISREICQHLRLRLSRGGVQTVAKA